MPRRTTTAVPGRTRPASLDAIRDGQRFRTLAKCLSLGPPGAIPPFRHRPYVYRTATLDMIFIASCAPAVNAKVGTRVRQHALPIPRRYVCLESLGPQTLYVLTCLCPLPEIPACTVAPPGFMSAAD